ncbi:MAG TPA: hypothetical protein VME01_10445, partial [Solirubrobacteraceae bacterium]|nr:hypothetical protein [Solirubrobacteraceae bacterium]
MKSIRRSAAAFLVPLLLVVGMMATAAGSASAFPGSPKPAPAPAPTQMSYACALKAGGLLRYVSSTAQCLKSETPVTISPGPTYV